MRHSCGAAIDGSGSGSGSVLVLAGTGCFFLTKRFVGGGAANTLVNSGYDFTLCPSRLTFLLAVLEATMAA